MKSEIDLKALLGVQRELIEAGLKFLKPGGLFIYSVCSVLQEEGQGHFSGNRVNGEKIKEELLSPADGREGDGFWFGIWRVTGATGSQSSG